MIVTVGVASDAPTFQRNDSPDGRIDPNNLEWDDPEGPFTCIRCGKELSQTHYLPGSPRPLWSSKDDATAHKQGWGVFHNDTEYQIQRIDCPEEVDAERAFATDDAAATYVQQQADAGDQFARRAIAFLIQNGSKDVAKFGLHLSRMSLAQFRHTRQDTLDLGSIIDNPDLRDVKGHVYLGVLHITDYEDGNYCLVLNSGEHHCSDLKYMEWLLFQWAANNGYFKKSGPESDDVYP